MKTTLSIIEVAHALLHDDNAAWSYEGARALAGWFDDMEVETETEIELDVVAIRCDFSEFGSLQDWIMEYYGQSLNTSIGGAGIDLDGDEDEDDIDELIRSHIQDHGQLIEFNGGIIVSSF